MALYFYFLKTSKLLGIKAEVENIMIPTVRSIFMCLHNKTHAIENENKIDLIPQVVDDVIEDRKRSQKPLY